MPGSAGLAFTVRLVKGAYWDYETIIAAQEHWPSPVFTDKAQTDAQFEQLAKVLIDNWEWTRPAVGSHNIRSLAAAVAQAEAAGLPAGTVELQMLHGMAEPIRQAAVAQGYRVREYVPVGELIPGMAYLVRRLLENTANESFLRLTFSQQQEPEQLLAAPGAAAPPDVPPEAAAAPDETATAPESAITFEGDATAGAPPARAALPPFQNEPHADFSRPEDRTAMEKALATIRGSLAREYAPLIGGLAVTTETSIASTNPARPEELVGTVAVRRPR